MMKRLSYLFLLLAVGCATLGLPTPQTFNERLLAAYAGVTTVRDGGDKLLVARKISSADAENVQKQADNVRQGLDLAASMKDPVLAANKLSTTVAILTALQTYQAYLETRKP
jgi:hypothetical protein